MTSIFTLAFGILAIAGEYRHRTITDTYLSTPARGRVIGAKLAVYAVLGALSGALASLVGLGVAAAWWSDKGSLSPGVTRRCGRPSAAASPGTRPSPQSASVSAR